MARSVGPSCRVCRRAGVKLYLKGIRCDTVKCGVTRRKFPPGIRSWKSGKLSKYGIQFREKQNVKRFYGVLEMQFRTYFKTAERKKGNTGEILLLIMERRLDNVVYHLTFGLSRKHARQVIRHGHIMVNDRKVDIPSFMVKEGDIIKAVNKEASEELIKTHVESSKGRSTPSWLDLNEGTLEGRIIQLPTREEVSVDVQEQLIVEHCSR
jgi:small subunit ribosomal protein S4